MKIAFIGGGNMAAALIGGMVRQGMDVGSILVVEPFETARAKLTLDFGIICDDAPGPALGGVDAIVMACAERLGATAIATLDLRDFGAVQLVGRPELWPRDLERTPLNR